MEINLEGTTAETGFRKMKCVPRSAWWINYIGRGKKGRKKKLIRIRNIFSTGVPKIKNVETGSVYIRLDAKLHECVIYVKTKSGWKSDINQIL